MWLFLAEGQFQMKGPNEWGARHFIKPIQKAKNVENETKEGEPWKKGILRLMDVLYVFY
jgi:hypothetical protein